MRYIGARYVPLMMGEWDNTKSYEPLSVVTYLGNSYTSKKSVPIGVNITDDMYWVKTGNYNQQIEQMYTEWEEFRNEIDTHVYELFTNYAVTPEMFGAVGDGVTDDTSALQQALDTGKNVCLTFGQKYLITDSLYVRDLPNRKGRTIFADAMYPYRTLSSFVCRFDTVKPVFIIQEDGITFQNITIDVTNTTNNGRTLTVFKTDLDAADADLTITQCAIFGAYCIVDITGRGLRLTENIIAACSRIADINWEGESVKPWHDDSTGMRAYIINDNRFHSMSATSKPLLEILNGNVYGLEFCNNVLDRGYSSLVHAYSNINNWLITDNIFNGINKYGTWESFITFDGNVSQLAFTNNNFTNNIDNTHAKQIITVLGDFADSIIANNNIDIMINGYFIMCHSNVDKVVVSSNVIGKIQNVSTPRAILYFTENHNLTNSTFIANIIGPVTNDSEQASYAYVVKCTGYNSVVNKIKMFGNIVPSATAVEYWMPNLTPTNCIFDFTV